MVRKCPLCGKKFENSRRKYCSAECPKQGARIRQLNLNETRMKIEEKNGLRKNALRDIAREAREAGMSYGQYVALQNQDASFRKGNRHG